MDASLIAELATRVTRVEDKLSVNLPMIVARVEALEDDLKQRQADKEQAQRKEMGELRKQLAEAQTMANDLKRAAVEAAEGDES